MEENRYFQDALANFTHETAYGGAIRHLADMGYTVKQITEQLDFPAPYEKVRQAVWEHLSATEAILLKEPGSGEKKERVTYVKEYDRYGKTTFRRVSSSEEGLAPICWKEQIFHVEQSAWAERFLALMKEKLEENGEKFSYMSCSFGLMARKNPLEYESLLEALEGREREYVSGLPWENRLAYHRLNARMGEVLRQLCEAGQYQGECFFLKTGDRIRVEKGMRRILR